jgi:hypothetical protein
MMSLANDTVGVVRLAFDLSAGFGQEPSPPGGPPSDATMSGGEKQAVVKKRSVTPKPR